MDENSECILVGGIELHTAYTGFGRGKLTDNERDNPGLGYTIAYHGGDKGEATVFVYTNGEHDIPDGPISAMVIAEFNRTTREIISFRQTGGTRMELVSRYGTGSPDRGEEFLCAEFILTDAQGARRTFVYVTGYAKHFLKIRVTLRTNEATDRTARTFADAVARRLWWKGVN